ncbi:MAG: AlpA family phage regulatory protein [Macromonas bipunctata]|nr:AlpA family phage regulatory protein [Macromonas bipunctata]
MIDNQSHAVAGTAAPTWGILRLEAVKALTGTRSHATIYAHVKAGLFPDSIPLGLRAVGWPADEVQTIVAARVAGADDAELRALVQQLHAARRTKYRSLLGRVLDHTADNPAPAQQRAASHFAVVGAAT